MKFTGTETYVATADLTVAVNAAVTLERPLLVKGEPGTGKTELARQVAASLGLPIIEWHVKSTTRAQQGLYEYDAVSRLRDSQLGDERVNDVRNYIRRGKLWDAFVSEGRSVLLIDEIDKADIEFPNDLLQELDRMNFDVYETGERIDDSAIRIEADADMPAHRHGMVRVPRVTKTGPGEFRVDGMMMHMPGYWQLYVDVTRNGITERAQFDVDLD